MTTRSEARDHEARGHERVEACLLMGAQGLPPSAGSLACSGGATLPVYTGKRSVEQTAAVERAVESEDRARSPVECPASFIQQFGLLPRAGLCPSPLAPSLRRPLCPARAAARSPLSLFTRNLVSPSVAADPLHPRSFTPLALAFRAPATHNMKTSVALSAAALLASTAAASAAVHGNADRQALHRRGADRLHRRTKREFPFSAHATQRTRRAFRVACVLDEAY